MNLFRVQAAQLHFITFPTRAAFALGLLVGKTIGIAGASAAARRLRLGRLPRGVATRHIRGGATLAGIGFTVSLFIAGLAFESGTLADYARMRILAGSIASAAVGTTALGLGGRGEQGVRSDGRSPGGDRS